MDDREKLLHAIDRMLTGGNHVALIVPHYLKYTMTHDEAHKLIDRNGGRFWDYEAFCCWKCLMESRDYLEANGLIK